MSASTSKQSYNMSCLPFILFSGNKNEREINKKQLIVGLILIFFLITPFIYAEQPDSDIAPELKLKEEDFTYVTYKDSLEFIKRILNEYRDGKKYDPNSEINYIGIPNNILHLEGYGLIVQRDLMLLKLENAKLKGADKKEISDLEKTLRDIEKRIETFLKENIWVD